MQQESNPATSQPATPANPSDVKSTTAANVTAAQAIARFAQAEQTQVSDKGPAETEAATPPATPETPAAPETQPEGSEQPAGESAPTDLPEVSSLDELSQAPATTPTEGAEHQDEEGETDVLSPKSPLDPRLKEKIQKRIDKERAKRGELERTVDQLKSELAALKKPSDPVAPADTTQPEAPASPTAPPVPPVPLAEHNDIGKLKSLEQEAVAAVDTVQDLLDTSRGWRDYQVPSPDNPEETVTVSATKIGDKLYTREQLVEIRRKAISTMREVPQRIAFINAREAATQQAHELFPFLKDKNSPEYQQAQAWRRGAPWLNNLPNADLIIGVQIEGMKAIEARKKAAAKPADKPKPAAVMPKAKPAGDQAAVSTAGAVERQSVDAKQRQSVSAEMEKMRAKGGVSGNEVAAFLARKELLNSR